MNSSSTLIRPTIDVSGLPDSEMDHRASIWWGNLLLLAIESTMFALLLASYFYLRGNFTGWPPPQTNWAIARYHSAPALLIPTVNLVVIILSAVPMLVADRFALRMNCRAVQLGLIGCLALGIAAIWLRFHELWQLNFRWDDNAYGSIVWTTIGLHLTHLFVGSLENALMLAWLLRHGLDRKHARDVRVNAVYWYWIVGIWIGLYAILIIGPHLRGTS
jgi:heme/copper-type cytochrome/quinol oxidase subunit 3